MSPGQMMFYAGIALLVITVILGVVFAVTWPKTDTVSIGKLTHTGTGPAPSAATEDLAGRRTDAVPGAGRRTDVVPGSRRETDAVSGGVPETETLIPDSGRETETVVPRD